MPRVSHIQALAQKCWDKIADEFPKINSQTGVIQFSIDQQLRFPDFTSASFSSSRVARRRRQRQQLEQQRLRRRLP